ncbi:MAG: transposase [Chloroflexi bacterium]|nr:transposase [Chloroflexota bacterium]
MLTKGRTTDAAILAELPKCRLRAKLSEREALEGRFDAQHALIVGAILAKLDFLDEQITLLGDAIEELLAPFADAVRLLCTAQVIIAEVGPDVSVFPTDRHLASWAAQCPGNDQSAGKRRPGKTGKGSR